MLLLCNPKLHDIKRQPFSYAHQLCDSEIQKGHSRDDFLLLCDIWILSSKDLKAGIIEGSFTPMSGPWTGWRWRLRLLSRAPTYGPSTCCGFLTPWRPLHGDFGLWAWAFWSTRRKLPHLSDLALEVTQCHFCYPDSREGDQPPYLDGKSIKVTSRDGRYCFSYLWKTKYIIFFPPNGNLLHLKIIPYRFLKLTAA